MENDDPPDLREKIPKFWLGLIPGLLALTGSFLAARSEISSDPIASSFCWTLGERVPEVLSPETTLTGVKVIGSREVCSLVFTHRDLSSESIGAERDIIERFICTDPLLEIIFSEGLDIEVESETFRKAPPDFVIDCRAVGRAESD